jgi:maltose alpha-D-glucosyltransferase / alpha-amylase
VIDDLWYKNAIVYCLDVKTFMDSNADGGGWRRCSRETGGGWRVIETNCKSVLALRYDWRGNGVLFLHNFDPRSLTVAFAAGSADGGTLANLLSEDHSEADGRGQHQVKLEGYGYRWYRIGGLDYILRRSK